MVQSFATLLEVVCALESIVTIGRGDIQEAQFSDL